EVDVRHPAGSQLALDSVAPVEQRPDQGVLNGHRATGYGPRWLRRRVSRTCLATGAENWPPKPCCFSRTTATTKRGAFAGAKQTNQVVFTWATALSAVPVLPATWTPEICAAVPVPLWTAPTIICVISCAVCGLIARPSTSGLVREIVPPPCAVILSTTYGRMTRPPFAIAPAIIAICSGLTSIRSCPNASRPGSTLFWSFGSKRCVPL